MSRLEVKIKTRSLLSSALCAVVMLAGALSGGCSHPVTDSREQDAAALYNDLCALSRRYADSLQHAGDSAAVSALMERYESAYDRISLNVLPETDLYLDEGQNDTLKMLQKRLSDLRGRILKRCDAHLAGDTVAVDSQSDASAL